MTAFAAPPLTVAYDPSWVEVDLHGDLGAWAARTAAEMTARAAGRGSGAGPGAERVAAVLEGAGALARQAGDAAIALLLYPSLADGVRAVVRVCLVDLAGWEGEAAWAELLGSLAPAAPGQDPPEVLEVASPAGVCRRVRQRYTTGAGSERPVGEQLAYTWLFPDYGAGVVMTAAFADLLDAGRWRPALDALAAGVELDRAGGTARPG
jgi:hypothetical protein